MEESFVKKSNKWLEDISSGKSNQLETLTLSGLRILEARQGFIRCSFVVSDGITDGEGNWHAGAMATIIDDVGAAAIYSCVGHGPGFRYEVIIVHIYVKVCNVGVDWAATWYKISSLLRLDRTKTCNLTNEHTCLKF